MPWATLGESESPSPGKPVLTLKPTRLRSLQRALRLLRQSKSRRIRRLSELWTNASAAAGHAQLGECAFIPTACDAADRSGGWCSVERGLGSTTVAGSVGAVVVSAAGRSWLQRNEFRQRPASEFREPAAVIRGANTTPEFRRGAVRTATAGVWTGASVVGASGRNARRIRSHVSRG